MEIGLIGLGKMGGNMARRWIQGGHTVVGHARTAATVQALEKEGMAGPIQTRSHNGSTSSQRATMAS